MISALVVAESGTLWTSQAACIDQARNGGLYKSWNYWIIYRIFATGICSSISAGIKISGAANFKPAHSIKEQMHSKRANGHQEVNL
jgi:hypothetical protein